MWTTAPAALSSCPNFDGTRHRGAGPAELRAPLHVTSAEQLRQEPRAEGRSCGWWPPRRRPTPGPTACAGYGRWRRCRRRACAGALWCRSGPHHPTTSADHGGGVGRCRPSSTTDRTRTDAEVLHEARLLAADWTDGQLTAERLRRELRIDLPPARALRDQLEAERTGQAQPATDDGSKAGPLDGLNEAASSVSTGCPSQSPAPPSGASRGPAQTRTGPRGPLTPKHPALRGEPIHAQADPRRARRPPPDRRRVGRQHPPRAQRHRHRPGRRPRRLPLGSPSATPTTTSTPSPPRSGATSAHHGTGTTSCAPTRNSSPSRRSTGSARSRAATAPPPSARPAPSGRRPAVPATPEPPANACAPPSAPPSRRP